MGERAVAELDRPGAHRCHGGWPNAFASAFAPPLQDGLSVGDEHALDVELRRAAAASAGTARPTTSCGRRSSTGSSHTRSAPLPVSTTASPNASARCDGISNGSSVRRGLPIGCTRMSPASVSPPFSAMSPDAVLEPLRTERVAVDRRVALLAQVLPDELGAAHVVGDRDQDAHGAERVRLERVQHRVRPVVEQRVDDHEPHVIAHPERGDLRPEAPGVPLGMTARPAPDVRCDLDHAVEISRRAPGGGARRTPRAPRGSRRRAAAARSSRAAPSRCRSRARPRPCCPSSSSASKFCDEESSGR